ncbi:MAG: DUF5716 family protein [Bacillales bacterium]|jgi:hypothetical protein|nr:DUF5716 family protein [Bacillales bacterium]
MELFEVIPSNMFSVLTSKNKDIYIKCLFCIRKLFLQETIVLKKVLVDALTNIIELKQVDFSDDEDYDPNENSGKIALIIKKLEASGWIEYEYDLTTFNMNNIMVPPYSWKIINVLYDILNERNHPYTIHLFNVYNSLKGADYLESGYQFISLLNSIKELDDLLSLLKNLDYDIRKRIRYVSSSYNTYDILKEHFDDYQNNIVRQIFFPLNTRDSIQRYKGSILQILISWQRDPVMLEKIANLSTSTFPTTDFSQAKMQTVKTISSIQDKLVQVEELVELIYKASSSYVALATQKMKHFSSQNRSTKKKLASICKYFAKLDKNTNKDLMFNISNVINLQQAGYIDEFSLYSRANQERKVLDDEQTDLGEMETFGDYEEATAIDFTYSDDAVINKMHELLDDKTSLHLKDWNLVDDKELVLSIKAIIKGIEPKAFFKTVLGEDLKDEYENNKYLVPDVLFEVVKK